MFERRSPAELRKALTEVEEQIAQHPLGSEEVQLAHQVITAHDGDDKEAIEAELKASNLPSLAKLGEIQAKGTLSWWKLHRKRKKLIAKLG